MKRSKVVKLASRKASQYDWLVNSGVDLMLRKLVESPTVFTETYWEELQEEFVAP